MLPTFVSVEYYECRGIIDLISHILLTFLKTFRQNFIKGVNYSCWCFGHFKVIQLVTFNGKTLILHQQVGCKRAFVLFENHKGLIQYIYFEHHESPSVSQCSIDVLLVLESYTFKHKLGMQFLLLLQIPSVTFSSFWQIFCSVLLHHNLLVGHGATSSRP